MRIKAARRRPNGISSLTARLIIAGNFPAEIH
jgi:hypothetical protein